VTFGLAPGVVVGEGRWLKGKGGSHDCAGVRREGRGLGGIRRWRERAVVANVKTGEWTRASSWLVRVDGEGFGRSLQDAMQGKAGQGEVRSGQSSR
jgi:hypothetical protein